MPTWNISDQLPVFVKIPVLTKGTCVSPLRDFPMSFIDLGRLRAVWDSPKSMKTLVKSSKGETPVPFVRFLHEYWELIRDISCEHSLNDLLSILFCRIFILARWFSRLKNSQFQEGWSGTSISEPVCHRGRDAFEVSTDLPYYRYWSGLQRVKGPVCLTINSY